MASLYEIDQEILNCIDPETGEIVDVDKLAELQMEREAKVENVALWIKNLKADMAAYKAEKDTFAEREKQAKAKAEKLSEWLTMALNGEKMTTNRVAISFRKSEAVEVVDESLIPDEFMRTKVESVPDKVIIKDALKNGVEVPGCALVENKNIQIK